MLVSCSVMLDIFKIWVYVMGLGIFFHIQMARRIETFRQLVLVTVSLCARLYQ